MNDITISYLTWKNLKVFRRVLDTHRKLGLFSIIPPENRRVFFQEISDPYIKLAKRRGLKYIGDTKNIGILEAFIELVKSCNTKYFIFCEDDFTLIENKPVCLSILEDCLNLLEDKRNFIRLRSLRNPGPSFARPMNLQRWLAKWSNKAESYPLKIESLSWLKNPEQFYKKGTFSKIQLNHLWLSTSISNQHWSNNPFICRTESLKNIILPLLEAHKDHADLYGGLEKLMKDLLLCPEYYGVNKSIDRLIDEYKNINMIGGHGLFRHSPQS